MQFPSFTVRQGLHEVVSEKRGICDRNQSLDARATPIWGKILGVLSRLSK